MRLPPSRRTQCTVIFSLLLVLTLYALAATADIFGLIDVTAR